MPAHNSSSEPPPPSGEMKSLAPAVWHTSNPLPPVIRPLRCFSRQTSTLFLTSDFIFLSKSDIEIGMGKVCSRFSPTMTSRAQRQGHKNPVPAVERLDGVQISWPPLPSGRFLARSSPTNCNNNTDLSLPNHVSKPPAVRPLPRRGPHYCRRRDFETSPSGGHHEVLLFANFSVVSTSPAGPFSLCRR
jgi:hypothetical protein